MKYKIGIASSMLSNNSAPCEEAYSIGKNKWGEDLWYVDINSLEELHEFINRYGSIVLYKPNERNWHDLVIYDDYIE